MSAAAAPVIATRAQIDEFLKQKRFAAIGVARDQKDFTRTLVREFISRGYDVVPVHPGAQEIEGRECFKSVQDITPPVSAALLLTSPTVSEQVVRECATAGITHVWLYGTGVSGTGAVSQSAVAFCHERRISVIVGECPFMFLPHPGFQHRVHGLIRKIMRSYPR